MILQKQIITSKSTILVIGGLPEDAENIRIDRYLRYFSDGGAWIHEGDLPPGDWQPLGFLKDITEDVAKGLVDKISRVDYIFMNYTDENEWCWCAIQSLNSLIEANCKLKNKYGNECPVLIDYKDDPLGCASAVRYHRIGLWKQEQSKVFTNLFLLKKV